MQLFMGDPSHKEGPNLTETRKNILCIMIHIFKLP